MEHASNPISRKRNAATILNALLFKIGLNIPKYIVIVKATPVVKASLMGLLF